MYNTYSQHGEDLIIAKLFTRSEGDQDYWKTGNLLEIGAYEPTEISNSRLLIERGWDATLIEFSPTPVKDLVKAYADNPNVRVIAAALTTCHQHVQEFNITDDGLSSNDPVHAEKWKDFPCGYYGKLWVPSLSVQAMMDQFFPNKPLHFVSIDTEGTSVPLAVEFMRLEDRWKPLVLCVEHDDQDAEEETELAVVHRNAVKAPRFRWLMENAEKRGYRLEWMNNCNAILVLK